jgi:hypothetical protein
MGVLTFIKVRPPETGLIGSLAAFAFAFALPVLRGVLPGSPPLGITADMWLFLWAEMGECAGARARGLQMGACRPSHLRSHALVSRPSRAGSLNGKPRSRHE